MMAERNRIATSKRGVSPKKKTTQSSKPKAVKPKPAWDSYLVPDNVYKLEPKKLLEKKNNLVSKNNIFINDNDVSVGYRPQSVLRERHSNIITSPQQTMTPAPKKEKKESDALDLIMSAKEKEVGRAVNQKSPARTRGTSSFALPTKQIKPKTPKTKNTEESEPTEQDEAPELHEDEDSVHEFELSTQLFGQSERRIHHAVAGVVKDQRQHLLQQKTAQLAQRLHSPESVPFRSMKDTISASKAAKSIRTPSPHRSSTKVHTPDNDGNTSKTLSAKVNTPTTTTTTEKDYDLLYVVDEIRSLFGELKYYEELSGRRSILDTREELDAMLQDKALLHPESYKPVMRYLVELLCQSMTYLLKSEVDLQQERTRYETLNTKFETLNALLAEDSVLPGVAGLRSGMGSGSVEYDGRVEYGVNGGESSGIAYAEDDLYPSQFTSPIRNTTNTTTYATTPHNNNTTNTTPYATNNTTHTSTTRHDAPSPSLKMIAQQYANDDLYPIPMDSEHSLHYDDYEYEASFVVADVKNTPMSKPTFTANTTDTTTHDRNTTHTGNTIPHAKVTSTPARFHETLAILSNTEHRANKLALNAPPSMLLSTPVRSVASGSNGGVSSTATTPQVMPYTTRNTRDYTALGVYSPNTNTTTPQTTTNYYTQLNSPAVYVDAYSSYLPSAPSNTVGSNAVSSGNNNGSSDDVLATPTRQTSTDQMQAGLARVDEIINYSRSIGNTSISASGGGNGVNTSISGLGDEYSTIARLSGYKHTSTSNTTNADTSMYSVHSVAHNYPMDTSVNSVDATPARVRPQNHYTHLHGSVESHTMPPPPPTTHYTSNTSGSTSSNSGNGSNGMYMRQPSQASAATAQLLHTTLHPPTTTNNTTNISSGDSVHSVHSTTSSIQGLSGTSASDWLFGAFPNTNNNTSTTSSSGKGRNVMVGKNIARGGGGNGTSNSATPESHYVAPTTTMHTLPTTPYTTTHTTTHTHTPYTSSSNVVTPIRDMSDNKTHTPSTADLYKTTTHEGISSYTTPSHSTNTTNPTNTSSNGSTSPTSYNTTTPPPTAAVPSYLLHQHSTATTTNSTGNKSGNKVTAAGLVQVRGTTRLPSPMNGSKSSRIPLKAEAVSVIVPNTSSPSPHSAPVHPFAATNVTPPSVHSTMAHKLHTLQHHTQHYENEYTNNNATTPTLTLEPWQQVQKRVYDARNGSF